MSNAWRRRAPARVAAVLLVAGCGVPAAEQVGVIPRGEARPAVTEWRFDTREHLSLWYHALGFVLPGRDSLPLAIYSQAARSDALAAARRAGINRTPLEQAADSLAAEFGGSSRYDQLQFLPLYFENEAALFNGIALFVQAEGNPQRAGSQQGAQAVALLGNMFTTARQRRWIGEFARVVQQERDAYYRAWWRERDRALRPVVDSAHAEWQRLQPALAPLMQHLQLRGGEVLLVPSLAAEGRTVSSNAMLRAAVGAAPGTSGTDVVYEVLHELMYALVADPIQQYVAPAALRDLGEDVVSSRAAARAGLLVLERLAPGHAAGYRRFYLRAAGRPGSDAAAFRAAFPLPADLERGLARAVEEALAGI